MPAGKYHPHGALWIDQVSEDGWHDAQADSGHVVITASSKKARQDDYGAEPLHAVDSRRLPPAIEGTIRNRNRYGSAFYAQTQAHCVD